MSWLLDGGAIMYSYFRLPMAFTCFCVIHSINNTLYTHPKIRVKNRPLLALSVFAFLNTYGAVFFQYLTLTGKDVEQVPASVHLAGFICYIFEIAGYPTLQIFQHEADQRNGDYTPSM